MGKQAAEPAKPLVLGDRAVAGLRLVGDGLRASVEEAINTPAKVRDLLRTAGRIGPASRRDQMRVAALPGVRLILRETPERVELLELLTEAAFGELGFKVRPTEEGSPAW